MATILDRFLQARCVISGPLWRILRSGTNTSVAWKDYAPNPRLAIYDANGDSNLANPATLSDDLVLDKATGLVWARDANLLGSHNWLDSNTLCRELELEISLAGVFPL